MRKKVLSLEMHEEGLEIRTPSHSSARELIRHEHMEFTVLSNNYTKVKLRFSFIRVIERKLKEKRRNDQETKLEFPLNIKEKNFINLVFSNILGNQPNLCE